MVAAFDYGVLGRELVAAEPMRLAGVLSREAHPAKDVHLEGDGFEVSHLDTVTNAAEVVEGDNLEVESDDDYVGEIAASIEELDEELADLAEALVEGEFEDADGEVSEPVKAAESADISEEGVALDEPVSMDKTIAPIAIESDAAEANTDNAIAKDSQRDDDDKPSGGSVVEPKSSDRAPWKHARDSVVVLARRGGKAAAPIGARVLLLIAKPTAKLPASTRDTVGWLALYTGFLAVCVWGFLLMFRKPITPDPTAEAMGITGEVAAHTMDTQE
ncbi:MAG: hypothetical protein IIB04_05965 [Acidobacteria bacterium]|nr:hypothetical protein [Acidobacteriota bacterium]